MTVEERARSLRCLQQMQQLMLLRVSGRQTQIGRMKEMLIHVRLFLPLNSQSTQLLFLLMLEVDD